LSWYEAAEYSNWLSQQEGIPEDQWCYQRNDSGKFDKGMRMPTNYLQRVGYRLPTEAEWEFACRAGAETTWACGEVDSELVGKYAWWYGNSQPGGFSRAFPVASLKPNDLGLFDMHGNVYEWCQDIAPDDPSISKGEDRTKSGEVSEDVNRIIRSGSFRDQFRNIRCDVWLPVPPRARAQATGFRPARTLR
jgi:formylglycine-generating enzyme required for sulfatase activity